MEHLIDVYYLKEKQMFVPWTEGFALVAMLDLLEKSDMPPRVKRMRRRGLTARLVVYYENKFGAVTGQK